MNWSSFGKKLNNRAGKNVPSAKFKEIFAWPMAECFLCLSRPSRDVPDGKACLLCVPVKSMKHDKLRSVGHSLADSLASGCSLLIGIYGFNLHDDAARSPTGRLTLDLLNGRILEGRASSGLAEAVPHLAPAFARLCKVQGIAKSDFRAARATFGRTGTGNGFTLIIEDRHGRISETDYVGIPARRAIELDQHGRIRRRPVRRLMMS